MEILQRVILANDTTDNNVVFRSTCATAHRALIYTPNSQLCETGVRQIERPVSCEGRGRPAWRERLAEAGPLPPEAGETSGNRDSISTISNIISTCGDSYLFLQLQPCINLGCFKVDECGQTGRIPPSATMCYWPCSFCCSDC